METKQTTPKLLKRLLFDNENFYLKTYDKGILGNREARYYLYNIVNQDMVIDILINRNCITLFDDED